MKRYEWFRKCNQNECTQRNATTHSFIFTNQAKAEANSNGNNNNNTGNSAINEKPILELEGGEQNTRTTAQNENKAIAQIIDYILQPKH